MGKESKASSLTPEQKVIVLRSVAQYLERCGFSKCFKKLLSEAEIEKKELNSSLPDLEEVFCQFFDKGHNEAGSVDKNASDDHEKDKKEEVAEVSAMEGVEKVKKEKKKKKKKESEVEVTEEEEEKKSGSVDENASNDNEKKKKKKKEPKVEVTKENEKVKETDAEIEDGHKEKKKKKTKSKSSEAESLVVDDDNKEKVSKKRKRSESEETKEQAEEEDDEESKRRKKEESVVEETPVKQADVQENGNVEKSGNKSGKGLSNSKEPKKPFQRVNVEEVVFTDDRLKDNSYWAKDGADSGYGAKAQEVLGQVRGRGFRHEKTKKKRGSYRGGEIDLQSHSVKFEYSDDE